MRRPALTLMLVAVALLSVVIVVVHSRYVHAADVQEAHVNAVEARPVTVVKPARRDITRWIKLPASVEADAAVTLYAKVSGFLKDFKVDVGDQVKPGQVIGKLEAPELEQDVKLEEAHVTAAQGEYQKAQAELDRLQMRGDEIDAKQKVLEAELLKAKADASRIHRQYDRTAKLFANNAATEQDKEYQEDTCAEQDALVKESQGKIDALKPERDVWAKDLVTSRAAVETARGHVAVAEATLNRARVWLAYSEIKVPQIGTHIGATAVIAKRHVSNGDLIAGGVGSRSGTQPLVSLEVEDPLRVVAEVPENESVSVECGTAVQIFFMALPKEKPFIGKVTRVSHALSSMARTMRVEVDIPNSNLRLRSGMMASMELAADVHKDVLAVPAVCVLTERQNSSVFAVENGKAKKVYIDAGVQDHLWIEVRDKTISESIPLIQEIRAGISDGMSVSVREQ